MMKNLTERVTKTVGLIALITLGSPTTAQTTKWSQAGPVYNAGRARNMVVDKNDATGKTLYVGSSTSGIFKTIDGGANWFPVNDKGTVTNISYMAQSKDGVIYAATGEGFLNKSQRAKVQPGTGLYKLSGKDLVAVSGGSSSVVGTIINRVACSPADANKIALATNKGIMISTDGGSSFNLAQGVVTSSLISGMDVKFDNTGVLYCSVGSERGDGATTYSTVISSIWKSSDASLSSFANITPSNSALPDLRYGRIELAIAPSNNNVIYASIAKKNVAQDIYTPYDGTSHQLTASAAKLLPTIHSVFVSYNGGQSWAMVLQGSGQIDPFSSGGGYYASGDYAQVLLVNPTNPNFLFIGGYSCFVYMRTGGTNDEPLGVWGQYGSSISSLQNVYPFYLHENTHDIKFISSSTGTKIYFVTDAGIYRCSDYDMALSQSVTVSFQPFYKGLVTGQYNSVSIARYPTAEDINTAPAGSAITPNSGFVGGTSGNGLNYFSGTAQNVVQEVNYLTGEVFNAEFSKILPNAVYSTDGSGGMLHRTTNIKTTTPDRATVNSYKGSLSEIAPAAYGPRDFPINTAYIGRDIPFKLWEYYGQTSENADRAVFYNDTLRVGVPINGGVATLTTQTSFSFDIPRPSRAALIDSVVIRTGTTSINLNTNISFSVVPTPFTGSDLKDVCIKLNNTYTVNSTGTTVPPITTSVGNVPVTAVSVTLDAASLSDKISVTYSLPPFAAKTITAYNSGTTVVVADPAVYYRLYATVFYKYKLGDSVTVEDESILTQSAAYSTTLSAPLAWKRNVGSISQTISATQYPSIVSNPTYSLNNGVTQSSPVFTVTSAGTYTISQFGTYTLDALPVVYSVTAETPISATAPAYTLLPGNITQTVATFTLDASAATDYTIIAVDDDTAPTTTVETYITVESSYTANPSSIVQTTPQYTLTATAPTIYTIQGSGSYTVATLSSTNSFVADSTEVSYDTDDNSLTPPTVKTITASATISFTGNDAVKFPMNGPSARLAMVMNNGFITGGRDAIVVSKNPLALNDPLNFVVLSGNGCLTTKADGTPDMTATVAVTGKATLIEWSNSGTELYYATDANKLYRVSNIREILDFSGASYNGKLHTNAFLYGTGITTTVNPNTPYRTALIGEFTKTITSISVSNDDQNVVLTFSDPTGTIVASNTTDVRIANTSNIGWTSKTGNLTNVQTYSSLMEKGDKKKVFVGTERGLYYTSDISAASPSWIKIDSLPNVQINDIEQQVLNNGQCYNAGVIYVATIGRGIWYNEDFFTAAYVSVPEYEKAKQENHLSIYPNPTNGNVTIAFNSADGETAVLNVMDINGRVVKFENLGKINAGDINYSFDVNELPAGIYIVSVNSNANVKRVTKLIVTK